MNLGIFTSAHWRSLFRRFFPVLALPLMLALITEHAIAQVPGVSIGQNFNGETATPLPGGHDYIHLFSETVNPSNGSVAFNIQLPIPKGRGLTLPDTAMYNSASVYHLGQDYAGNLTFVPTDLTPSSFPLVSWSESSFAPIQITCPPGCNPPIFSQCNVANGFTFNDPSGMSHNLGLGIAATSAIVPEPYGAQPCPIGGPGVTVPTTGGTGDGKVWARFTSPGQSGTSASVTAVQNWSVSAGSNQGVNGPVGAFTVTDEAGTTYFFDGNGSYDSGNQVNWEYPYKIEDRNGNLITAGTGIFTDTLGRPMISGSTIGGLVYPNATCVGSCPSSTSVSYQVPNSKAFVGSLYPGDTSVACPTSTANMNVSSSQSAWTGLALPTSTPSNPQQYTYYYGGYTNGGTTNSYGLLNEVTYPDGGWVKYTWKLSTDASVSISGTGSFSEMGAFEGQGQSSPGVFSGNGYPGACLMWYATPVLASRTVSYDGVNVAQTQTFKYQTTWGNGQTTWDWTAKQTYATTTDNVTGTSYLTVYNYLPTTGPSVGPFSYGSVAGQIPLESSIVYHATSSPTSTVLRTVTKFWADMFNLSEVDTTENGLTSKTTYGYTSSPTSSPFTVLASKWEYDFGATSPTRKTTINYQTFPAGPFGTPVPAQPSSVIVSNSSASVAETDYAYDSYGSGIVSVTAVQHDDTNYSATFTNRGNMTSMTKKCFICTDATASYMYDQTGQPASMTDPKGNTSTYSFTDSPVGGNSAGNSDAYLTQVTYPQTGTTVHQESFQYNYTFGDLTQSTDENSQISTYQYADPFDRLTKSAFPDGGVTNVAYTDSPTSPSVATCQLITGSAGATCSATTPPSGWKTSVALIDGMFHTKQTQLVSDPDGVDYVDTAFDGLGRTRKVSNPHRSASASTDGTATTVYDVLGRPITITEQDGSTVQTAYDQTCKTLTNTLGTTVTDEAGHQRRTCTDGLGRLVEVDEPSSTGLSTPLVTLYSYDALGNLLCVVQKGTDTTAFTNCASAPLTWRPRSFTYDSFSRLTSASNPESGAISYTYDTNSNVVSKTALSPNQASTGTSNVVTSYTYDALNRLTGKSYNDSYSANNATNRQTLPVLYGYDGVAPTGCTKAPPILADTYPVGRRTSMCDASGSTSWNHDQMGRILIDSRFIGSVTPAKRIAYGFNPDGSMSSVVTPPMKYIAYTYVQGGLTAGRATQAVDLVDNINFVTGATYAPPGELQSFTDGGAINGAVAYNSRLQPTQLFYGTNTPPAITSMTATCPSTVGNIMNKTYGFGFGTVDNGNVLSITNCRDTTRTQTFTYDVLNRIASAQSSGSQWGETFTIDTWGNLTNETQIAGKTNHEGLNTTAGTNNQLAGFGYDAAGNMTSNTAIGATYVYDDENRLIWTSGERYLYDGDGKRVEKCVAAASTTACPTSGTNGTLYWRGTGSDTLDETDLSGNPVEEYIFFNGTRIARRDVTSTGATIAIHYYFSDQVGSHSVVTNAAGTATEQDVDYYPYGGVENDYCAACVAQRYKFNGKERDTESGLDNFGARYDTSSLGRFMTPDWAAKTVAVPYANFGNPQSLNLYSYVENNPTTLGDPDGHVPWSWGGGGDCPGSADQCQSNMQETSKEKWQQNADKLTTAAASAQSTAGAAATGVLKELSNTARSISITSQIGLGDFVGAYETATSIPEQSASNSTEKTAMTVTFVATLAVPVGGEAKADEVLTRFGSKAESTVERLATDAATAENAPQVGNRHGVSAMANSLKEGGKALRSEVEKVFEVANTGRNPDHRTIMLPKPVTDAVAAAFNKLFWP